ncbi:MAG TPA: ATP-binding protein [Gemmatimonadales bacterium]|nr:ATP-binding protein [Gemmatimonadales bacterium]
MALVVATEWLRNPGLVWVVLAFAAALSMVLLEILPATRAGLTPWYRGWLPPIAALGLALAMGIAQWRIAPVGTDWPAERERRVSAAFQRLSGELRAAVTRADQLSAAAIPLGTGTREAAFAELGRVLPRDQAEMAVVILESTGVPWAWAGRHRLAPEAEGDSLSARFTRFYAVLESRRHLAEGRVAVATVLIWADSAVPRADRSLAARFANSAGVQLRVFAPQSVPRSPDIFDYVIPGPRGDRLLFSIQPVPPEQEIAERAIAREVEVWVGLALLTLVAVLLLTAPGSRERWLVLLGLLWAASRGPLGTAVGLDDLFSPANFRRAILGRLSSSPGHLLLTSSLVLIFAAWLRGKELGHRRLRILLGSLLLLGAPYLVSELGRGIIPPLNGVPSHLWITWQVTLAVATSALIVLAAALFRGKEEPRDGLGWVALGSIIALGAAVVGLTIWVPRVGWPEWYTFLWTPALFLAARPAPRWALVGGTAIVAGSAAALVTWGAELNGRISVAQADLARLGDIEDPLAEPYLERFADQIEAGPEPTSPAGMFVAWRSSYLAGQEFPVRLALWEQNGLRRADLALDSLDIPTPLLAALVRSFDTTSGRTVVRLFRVPGRYHVLLQRLPSGRILTAAVGPRSRALAPARIARLLRPPAEGAPLYEISLTPPFTRGLVEEPTPRWIREDGQARSERLVDFPDGARHVHATVTIRPMPLLLVRGALLVALDAAILALLWILATLRIGGVRGVRLTRLMRSFQVRLALTLALFFILPAVGFTAWGLGRLGDEADRTRDLLITSVLRDAVLTAGGLLQEPGDVLTEGVSELSNRLDADLVLYSGGRLVAASAPILEDLSLVEPLVDARVFQRLTVGDELEVTRQATTYVAPVRVGYRVAQAGPPGGIGILATAQLASDWRRTQDQRDLAFGLLLATLVGLGGALLAAQLVARALSRPVTDLQRLASAVGQGAPLPPVGPPATEFERVFRAFERMATDIRASQAALEEARRRTAAVLSNVATGVVAIDASGHVILANPRAHQLLGAALQAGRQLSELLPASWGPLVHEVRLFLEGRAPDRATEVEVEARLYRVQLVRLDDAGGAVLAVDDLTDVSQAARVLAWGEMARQVAHEIKNPLTPIRLGVQHLRRVRRDRPEQFEQILDETSTRILSEIDRLDTIARAFSRFGLPGNEQVPLESVDIGAVAREVVGLYRLTADGVTLDVEGTESVRLPARKDEVKEVMGNLLENARNAGARRIVMRIGPRSLALHDDGHGIPAELLPRIFEPRFSTTTSGSGLGLAIVRRLVESWGAQVEVQSEAAHGTTVTVEWPA